jgi:hypothetical protein
MVTVRKLWSAPTGGVSGVPPSSQRPAVEEREREKRGRARTVGRREWRFKLTLVRRVATGDAQRVRILDVSGVPIPAGRADVDQARDLEDLEAAVIHVLGLVPANERSVRVPVARGRGVCGHENT